jgi:AbrB family looped-hinge helix DNA binding protein
MAVVLASLTSKGQLTVPKEVRQWLGLQPGDLVEFTANDAGETIVRRRRRYGVEELFGSLPNNGVTLTVEEMHDAAVDAVVEKYRRSLPRK